MKLGEALEWCIHNSNREIVVKNISSETDCIRIRFNSSCYSFEGTSGSGKAYDWIKIQGWWENLQRPHMTFEIALPALSLEDSIKAFGCQADNVRAFVKAFKEELKK